MDFEVVDIYPPPEEYPVVQGDWVEVAAFIRNAGEYAGRASVSLWNLTHDRLMYEQGISLGPGESEIATFTWKTLRYQPGSHEIQVLVEAEHDTDHANDRSESASTAILPNRDITLGFAGDRPDQQISGAAKKITSTLPGVAPQDVVLLQEPASENIPPSLAEPRAFLSAGSAPPASPGSNPSHATPHRDARMSPDRCVQLQRMSSAVRSIQRMCPGVLALVR